MRKQRDKLPNLAHMVREKAPRGGKSYKNMPMAPTTTHQPRPPPSHPTPRKHRRLLRGPVCDCCWVRGRRQESPSCANVTRRAISTHLERPAGEAPHRAARGKVAATFREMVSIQPPPYEVPHVGQALAFWLFIAGAPLRHEKRKITGRCQRRERTQRNISIPECRKRYQATYSELPISAFQKQEETAVEVRYETRESAWRSRIGGHNRLFSSDGEKFVLGVELLHKSLPSPSAPVA